MSARCGASTCDYRTCKRYVRALYNVRAACHRTLGLVTNVRALSLSVSRASNGISLSIFSRAPSTGSPRSYATSIDSTLKHVVSESTVATDHPKVLCVSNMTESDHTVNPKILPVDAKKNILRHDGNATAKPSRIFDGGRECGSGST